MKLLLVHHRRAALPRRNPRDLRRRARASVLGPLVSPADRRPGRRVRRGALDAEHAATRSGRASSGFDPPEGLPLGPIRRLARFTASIEDIGRTIGAPPVDSIAITGDFNASAVTHRPPWRLRRTPHAGARIARAHDPVDGGASRRHCARARPFLERARSVRSVGVPNPQQLVRAARSPGPTAGDPRVRLLADWLVCAAAEHGLRRGRPAPRARRRSCRRRSCRCSRRCRRVRSSSNQASDSPTRRTGRRYRSAMKRPLSPHARTAQMLRWDARTASTDVLEDLFARRYRCARTPILPCANALRASSKRRTDPSADRTFGGRGTFRCLARNTRRHPR